MVLFCLQCWWGEVRNIVRCIYREAGTSLAGKWLFYDLLLSTCNYLFINFIYLFITFASLMLFIFNIILMATLAFSFFTC